MNKINTSQKGLIIFESKYGATLQYAASIAGELALSVTTPAEVSARQLLQADFLVIGTPVYNGFFKIKSWLKKQVKAVSRKNCSSSW